MAGRKFDKQKKKVKSLGHEHNIYSQFPGPDASTTVVHGWIKAWLADHLVEIDESCLRQISWDGTWIHQQSQDELQWDIESWDLNFVPGRMLLVEILQQRA